MTDLRAATDAAKAALYNEENILFSSMIPALPVPTIAWNFEELSDSSLPVSRIASQGGQTLTDINACASVDGPSIAVPRAVKISRIKNQRLQRDNEPLLQMGDISYTIAFMAYLDSKPANMCFMTKGLGGGGSIEWMFLYEAIFDKLRFTVYDQTTLCANPVYSTQAIPLQTWFHVAAGYDKDLHQTWLSLNSSPAAVMPVTHAPTVNAMRLYIGSDTNTFFDGRIAAPKIWKNLRLTPDQINLDYNLGNGMRS